jgi:pantetheine-phosphate adenylyltransferase
VDSAWIENDGRLIAEWYESSDDDDGTPYDHADMITFDTDGKAVLAKAMGIPASDDRLLAEIQKRFRNQVEVRQFAGLAVQFVRQQDARVIIRGVRSLSDMDTEFTMTLANRKLDPGIETVFLMADEEFSHVSSSLLKQITPLATDEELARFVPREIIPDLRRKIATV